MKAAVITLPLNHNYGGIIQAWALQKTLARLGIEAQLLAPPSDRSLSSSEKLRKYPVRAFRKILLKQPVDIHIERSLNFIQKKYFNRDRYLRPFINRNIKVRGFNRLSDIRKDEYDAIVIGSDQIWRPKYAVSFDVDIKNSFARFARRWNIPLVSYAASFGIDSLREFQPHDKRKISRVLQKFKGVSVREKEGVELCRDLGVEAVQLVDPTLLVNREDYEKLIPDDTPKRKGIMTYVLDPLSNLPDIINRIQQLSDLECFSTLEQNLEDVAPLEHWLAGFRDADFVVTDSFHACIFSIIFSKPFVVVANESRGNSRINSLLELFGLQHHLVTDPAGIKNIDDYRPEQARINSVIEAERAKSFEFLKKALLS